MLPSCSTTVGDSDLGCLDLLQSKAVTHHIVFVFQGQLGTSYCCLQRRATQREACTTPSVVRGNPFVKRRWYLPGSTWYALMDICFNLCRLTLNARYKKFLKKFVKRLKLFKGVFIFICWDAECNKI